MAYCNCSFQIVFSSLSCLLYSFVLLAEMGLDRYTEPNSQLRASYYITHYFIYLFLKQVPYFIDNSPKQFPIQFFDYTISQDQNQKPLVWQESKHIKKQKKKNCNEVTNLLFSSASRYVADHTLSIRFLFFANKETKKY